jgi:starch synthase
MRVLSVASEAYPLVKTGGLADVAGALPAALSRLGVEMRTLLPGYPQVLAAMEAPATLHSFEGFFGGAARLLAGPAGGLDVLALDAPHLFDRKGGPYADENDRDWPDNSRRFAALAFAAAEIGRGAVAGPAPDVVQAHDWQAGLAPAYLHYLGGPRPATVTTVHNLAFQGRFAAEAFADLRLPREAFGLAGVEYFGGVGFLKAGLQFADRITTVSPTYAAEIATEEGGMGLGGLVRGRAADVRGILNGIDTAVWNPRADPHLRAAFSAEHLEFRLANKRALRERFGLSGNSGSLLFGVVSRLSWQKGLDLLLEALPSLLALGADLVVLGAGEKQIEADYRTAAAANAGRVGVAVGYDEPLAHLIQGGADALIVPSRFEPCGLTQLCALRYGAAPVVSRVGGLNDTIIDANEMALAAGVATGIQFAPATRAALEHALLRAAGLWKRPQAWRRMQLNGMATELGWNRAAEQYAALYAELRPARS